VPEHLDTKSIVKVASCSENHITIAVKWRPFGRSNNRSTQLEGSGKSG